MQCQIIHGKDDYCPGLSLLQESAVSRPSRIPQAPEIFLLPSCMHDQSLKCKFMQWEKTIIINLYIKRIKTIGIIELVTTAVNNNYFKQWYRPNILIKTCSKMKKINLIQNGQFVLKFVSSVFKKLLF